MAKKKSSNSVTKKEKLSPSAYRHVLDYQASYNPEHYRQFVFRLNKLKEENQSIIAWLDEQEDRTKYIIDLIRKDMVERGIK